MARRQFRRHRAQGGGEGDREGGGGAAARVRPGGGEFVEELADPHVQVPGPAGPRSARPARHGGSRLARSRPAAPGLTAVRRLRLARSGHDSPAILASASMSVCSEARDRCVLAMQTGKPPKPFFSYMASCPEEISGALGMVMFVAALRVVEVAASSRAVSGSRVDDRLRLCE